MRLCGMDRHANIPDLNEEILHHNQEEEDTSIVLHAVDVSRRNPFTELLIFCSDTDVLLILLNYFEEICSSTIFRARTYVTHVSSIGF